jgi:tetratricopeptide (TPR) repeat protein
VESVAWVAERKDVLCAFFYLLALIAWGRFARGLRWGRGAALAACALALLAKPMAVSLPLALWIVDPWPLRRVVPLRQRLRETLPFALAAAGARHAAVQLSSGGTGAWMTRRAGCARVHPVAYLRYLELTLWPAKLAVLYPPGRHSGMGEVVAARRRAARDLRVRVPDAARATLLWACWLWFGVTRSLPVIGLVRRLPGIADRYTYLPSLGLSVALAFGAAECAARLRLPVLARAGIALLALAALAFVTQRQVGYWRDGITLYARALAVTKDNFALHAFLGNELAHDPNRRAEAIEHFYAALRIRPDFPHAHYGLAVTFEEDGRNSDAINEYGAALRANPDFAEAHFNMANLLGQAGQLEQAEKHYRRALELDPDNVGAQQGLALVQKLRAGR